MKGRAVDFKIPLLEKGKGGAELSGSVRIATLPNFGFAVDF
jgi:hypothetical protein